MYQLTSLLKTVITLGVGGIILAASSTVFGAKPDKLPPAPNFVVKTFHGSMCQPGAPYTEIVYDMNGVRNAYEYGPTTVRCPVVRDDATGTDGVYMARITVYDADPVGDISCTLYALDKWNVSVDQASTGTTGTPGNQILDLTITGSAEYGTYYLECDLPKWSGSYVNLKAYRIYEFQYGYDGMTDYDN